MDEHDSIKESLNQTGMFLERAVGGILQALEQPKYYVAHEVPYSVGNSAADTIDNTSDFLAVFSGIRDGANIIVALVIECKRANPNYKNWVFHDSGPIDTPHYPFVVITGKPEKSSFEVFPSPEVNYDYRVSLHPHIDPTTPPAVQVFEVELKGNGNTPRDPNKRVYEAAGSVNDALTGIAESPEKVYELASFEGQILFVPIIVTTASLWVPEYQYGDVSLQDGNVLPANLNLKQRESVLYDFPLKARQQLYGNSNGVSIMPEKRPTLVVSSTRFEAIAKQFSNVRAIKTK